MINESSDDELYEQQLTLYFEQNNFDPKFLDTRKEYLTLESLELFNEIKKLVIIE